MQKLPPYKTVPVDRLVPYAHNSRTHSAEQVAQVARSIQEFGFTNPVLVDCNNGIIAGHCRVLAASSIGMTDVPVIELAHFTPAQKRAYVIADNKLALNAGWDYSALKNEIGDIGDAGFSLDLLGFGETELNSILHIVEHGEGDSVLSGDALNYRIIIQCDCEAHQKQLICKLEEEGLKCQPSIS